MPDNDQTYGGFDDGLDWITDLAIEEYKLKKGKGADDDKKSKSDDSRRSNRRRNL